VSAGVKQQPNPTKPRPVHACIDLSETQTNTKIFEFDLETVGVVLVALPDVAESRLVVKAIGRVVGSRVAIHYRTFIA
jgi:hypothetical protein